MKFSEIDPNVDNDFTANELMEMDIEELIDGINDAIKVFNTYCINFLLVLCLGGLSLYLGYGFIFSLLFFVPSLGLLYMCLKKNSDRRFSYTRFNFALRFYESFKLLDDNNRYIIVKHVDRLNRDWCMLFTKHAHRYFDFN